MIIKHCFENVKILNLPPRPRTPLLPEGGEFGKQNKRMKNLTNILSYLWLLLLMAVTACSDLEEEVGPMHVEEEVELTIQTEVSGMKGSTRTAPTESIIAITAYAFDSNSQLIKVVKAILSDKAATNGNLKIKVPKRTGDIHFIAKNNAESPDVTISIGDNVSTLLSQTTDELHYWGKVTYNGGNNLSVTLYRNMAKVTLTLNNDLQGHIAGFVNYNQSGKLVPGNFEVGTLNATNDVASHSNGDLGTEHYLFEHANVENSNPLYVIIEVDDKYYKIAFASGDTYFPILRNRAYEITVTESLDEMYAENNYTDAVNSQYPINDLVITSVPMTVTASPAEVQNESGQTFTVTVTIPEGITELNVPTHDAFTIAPPNDLTAQNGKYTVTPGNNYAFTFTVKEDVEAGDKTISFSGRGKYKSATGSAVINLYDMEEVELAISPESPTVNTAQGSTTQLAVTIPDGITSLTVTTDAFNVTSNDVSLNNGSWDVSGKQGQTVTFTLSLINAGTADETKTVTFTGSGQKKTGTKEVTVTLQQPTANAIVAVPVANSLNYTTGENSVSDLLVNVTIRKGVTTLTFASDYFDAMVVGQTLALTDDAYTITHDENAESTTIPVRLRLKQDKKADTNASFTFGSKDANVESATINNIDLNPVSGENVRWQGNVPLNSADYATIVPLKWEWFRTGDSFIPAGSKLNLEFTVTGDNTSWLEVFEIRGETENEWNNPVHQFAELNNSNRYTADGNGNRTLSLTLSAYTFKTILENFRSNFLGETDIAMAIRGAGITLTKVSVVEQAALPVYELWFENNNTWNGSQDYATFFTQMGDLTTNNGNQGNMNDTFYDPSFTVNEVKYSGADAKRTNAMVMGENNSISFTIPDTRYLTLLVARNGNAPSINLQKNGQAWTAPSDEEQVPDTYNFSKDGDITTFGRLIRYTLDPGTYTLQRGNNDYLLYYMRVSKDKPTMTDTELVQVQANNYVLSWSDNTKDRFHKENDTKYFVDEEAKTFTAKLNYQEWQNVNLTTTNLGISTVTWTFDNSKEESQGTENSPEEEHSYDGNETVSIGYHNAGTYTLSGTVAPNASYKYAAFYDRLPLSPVNFEVKNTIKVGLYDSWDGDAAPVSTYTDGKPLILGFKWPSSTLPIEPDQQIQFTIPDVWVRDASGSGITYDDPNNGTRTYRIGNENNRYHPRTDWTYKIEWRDVAADNISATTTTNDIYFSYNGAIGKSVTIDTPITNDNLDVALDFYADLDNNSQIDDAENRSDNRYEDLQLGTTSFYLKATISYDDSEKYDSQTVQLQGAYPAYNGAPNNGSVIDWAGSRVSGDGNNNITYTNNNGNGLKFTVHRGVTEYFIEWVFKPTQQYQNGDIAFTYTLSNNQGYNVSGESPVIAFTNESNYSNNNVLNLPLNISLDFYRKYSDGTTDDNYDNLIYGVSRVGLKATITIPNGQNAADYYDKIVYLQGAFSNTSGTGNAGIHWDNSRDSGNDFEIAYRTYVNHDGTQLQFKIENGKTEYDIEWVFKGGSQYNSNNNNGNVGFTYTISALNGNHQISGQNSATLAIKRSADIFNGSIELNDWNSTIFDEIFPIGTNISLTYSKGGIAKFLNGYWQMLHIPEFENDYELDSNFYIRVGTDPIAFDVSEQIKLYNNETNAYESNLSSSLVALRIQGDEGSILQRVTVTAPPSAFPNNDP